MAPIIGGFDTGLLDSSLCLNTRSLLESALSSEDNIMKINDISRVRRYSKLNAIAESCQAIKIFSYP